MWIYLLRHGIAEDVGPGQSDDERALTTAGRDKLRRSAAAWRELVQPLPGVVLSSPLLRARQTADMLCDALGHHPERRIESALEPFGSLELTLALLESEQLGGADAVAVVGHEPHLGGLLGALLTGAPRAPIPLKKGMLVAAQTHGTTSVVSGLRWSLTSKAAARLS